jgi:uncharacterized protein YdiU (UPF0061 family)
MRVLETTFPDAYRRALLAGLRAKLGLERTEGADDEADAGLADDWLTVLRTARADFTLGWRHLAAAAVGDEGPLRALFADPGAPDAWLARWRERCTREDEGRVAADAAGSARAARMRRANPWVIPRNHRVEEALAAASERDDLEAFERLLDAVRRPFDETPENARFAEPAAPEVTAGYRTFCGT